MTTIADFVRRMRLDRGAAVRDRLTAPRTAMAHHQPTPHDDLAAAMTWHDWQCPVVMKTQPDHVAYTCARCGEVVVVSESVPVPHSQIPCRSRIALGEAR